MKKVILSLVFILSIGLMSFNSISTKKSESKDVTNVSNTELTKTPEYCNGYIRWCWTQDGTRYCTEWYCILDEVEL